MLVDKNKVIPFQKSTWNALCKMDFFKKYIPFFKTKCLDDIINQAPQQHRFCTVNSLLMLQKSLGYAINKFGRFYRVPEKWSISRKSKLQNLSHELKQRLFYQKKLLLIQDFDYRSKNGKRNSVSALLSGECITCLLYRG